MPGFSLLWRLSHLPSEHTWLSVLHAAVHDEHDSCLVCVCCGRLYQPSLEKCCLLFIPGILLWHPCGMRTKAKVTAQAWAHLLPVLDQCQQPPARQSAVGTPLYATKLLCFCSDVHGDMSAMVLSLRWPATSLNQALEMAVHTPPPKSKYRSPEQQAASQRAQHRWGQVKMLYVDFYRARRCTPSSHWC